MKSRYRFGFVRDIHDTEEDVNALENRVTDRVREAARRRRLFLWGNRNLCFLAMIALGILLSYVHLLRMPEGGEITFLSMLVICLIGYVTGPAQGVFGAVTFGIVKYMLDYQIFGPGTNIPELWDYVLGYSLLGVCGLLLALRRPDEKKENRMVPVFSLRRAVSIAMLLRFIESVANYLVFYPEAGMPFSRQFMLALRYCTIYIVPEWALSLLVLSIPPVMEAVSFLRIVANRDYTETYDYY